MRIDANRRKVLSGLAAVGGALVLGACAGGSAVSGGGDPAARSKAWPTQAFNSKQVGDALRGIYGDLKPQESDAITLDIPVIAEASLSVPLAVSTSLGNVSAVTILAANNANPLSGHYLLGPATVPALTTRIQLEKTTDVLVAVKSGERLYITSAEVKIISPDGCPV